MKVTGLKCLKCNDVIVSNFRHDWKQCKCGACFVDGGRDYFRRGGDAKYFEVVDVEIEDDKDE